MRVKRESFLSARRNSAMSGYCEDPENTDEAFGDGWLNTGELARRNEDRHLYFACRIKGDDPPDAP